MIGLNAGFRLLLLVLTAAIVACSDPERSATPTAGDTVPSDSAVLREFAQEHGAVLPVLGGGDPYHLSRLFTVDLVEQLLESGRRVALYGQLLDLRIQNGEHRAVIRHSFWHGSDVEIYFDVSVPVGLFNSLRADRAEWEEDHLVVINVEDLSRPGLTIRADMEEFGNNSEDIRLRPDAPDYAIARGRLLVAERVRQ